MRLPDLLLRVLQRSDVATNCNITLRSTIGAKKWHDRGGHPTKRAILVSVADLTMPNLTFGYGRIKLLKKLRRMNIRLEDPVILSDQFLARISANQTKPVVRIHDCASGIGGRHDRVLVQGKFLISQFGILSG